MNDIWLENFRLVSTYKKVSFEMPFCLGAGRQETEGHDIRQIARQEASTWKTQM